MKYDKSLKDVWDWKQKVYEESKGRNIREFVSNIEKKVKVIRRKYKLNLKRIEA